MDRYNRGVRIAGSVAIAVAMVFLALTLWLGESINFALPLVFLTLGPGFVVLTFALWPRWRYAPLGFLPAGLLSAMGLVFLLNVVTGDWNAWSYGWMLALAGLGAGTALAARYVPLSREAYLIGLGVAIGGVVLGSLFGAIAGGMAFRILAPLVLLGGGLALRYLRADQLLPPVKWAPSGPVKTGLPDGQPAVQGLAAPSGGDGLVEALSARELEVLRLIDDGLSNPEIAERLTLAPSTVKTHINNLYGKLGVQSRTQALRRARELGLLEDAGLPN